MRESCLTPEVVVLNSHVKRQQARLHGAVSICLQREQHLHRGNMAVLTGFKQWRGSVCRLAIYICT